MKSVAILLLSFATISGHAQTRGVGVYPGDPAEYFGPSLKPGGGAKRNLALRRAAYQSSAYDYNLTAQLATDGIVEKAMPRSIAITTSQQGALKKNEREWLLDGNWVTSVEVRGKAAWIEFDFRGGAEPLKFDRVSIDATVRGPGSDNQDWAVIVSGSDDGSAWKELGRTTGMARPTGEIKPSIPFQALSSHRRYRLDFASGRNLNWQVGDVRWFRGEEVRVAGPHHFASAWVPATAGEEWLAVDLGAPSSIERVNLAWLRPPAEGSLQVSDDFVSWRNVAALPRPALATPVQARYVRLLLTRAAQPEGYALSEIEVIGTGGVAPAAQAMPAPLADGSQRVSAGAWRVERAPQVAAAPATLSRAGFNDASWLPATVPGTTLASYLNAGAVPDPNYSDNINAISDSYFHADFWYRTEFATPRTAPGRRQWLDFDGINWKAEAWLNGVKLGRIEGGFQRARFDVTGKLAATGMNALAVLIEKNATPGSVKEKTFENPDKNGGALGADNPTFHASIGWDWIPTIRGRNTGIWNNVWLRSSGDVTLADARVTTLSIEGSRATVLLETVARNHGATPAQAVLRGTFGSLAIEKRVTLPANSEQVVRFDPLAVDNARLWWPVDYGDPDLYAVTLRAETGGRESDSKTFQAGIRQWRYSEEGGALRMWINGRRFIPRGGNWGFPESMLRYRAREYDVAVSLHRDQHFNMIRNWVGQIGEDAFYEACDRHGVVVWQDFWLANPWDGPEPDNPAMFLANARDTVRRIRNHASVGLYCGRNEGYPPKTLDDGIRAVLAEEHPGVHYIGSSADEVVSGHGPYRAQSVKQYFEQRATPKFHSEMGMPNIVPIESMRAMMAEKDLWPQGAVWGQHDFCLTGAQGGESFRAMIDKAYGGAESAEEWISLAQFVNYDGYRAMFEAQSKNRMGLLIWMSHPTWPSMVWQTYDYYFEPSAAYFGAKKAAEPLHIQWNAATGNVEVVNYNAGNRVGLTARAEILSIDGKKTWEQTATLDSPEDSVAAPITLDFGNAPPPVHFIRLTLTQAGKTLSENLYWRGASEGGLHALRQIPKTRVTAKTSIERKDGRYAMSSAITNEGASPALLVRIQALRKSSGDRILPAWISDSYFTLMPGESKTVEVTVTEADCRGESPVLKAAAFNQ